MIFHVSQAKPHTANAIHARSAAATAFSNESSMSGLWNGSMTRMYVPSE